MDDHTVGEEKISSGNWQFSKTNVFASLKVVNELIDLSVNCEEYVLLIKVFERKIVLFFLSHRFIGELIDFANDVILMAILHSLAVMELSGIREREISFHKSICILHRLY